MTSLRWQKAASPFDPQREREIMPDPMTEPGEIVDIRLPEAPLGPFQVTTMVKTDDLQVIRLIVSPGQDVPTHEIQGEMLILCLHGRVTLTALGRSLELKAKQMLQYSTGEPFSVRGIEKALLLIIVALPKSGERVNLVG
jgi:quercetin dioxygenase-like cupin family protein